jgi:hypothetical protein
MRVTTFREEGERVDIQVSASPPWQPFDQYDGKPLKHVRLVFVERLPLGEIQLVEIDAGGQFAMNSGPDIAF